MNTRAFTLSLIIAGIAMWMVSAYISGREANFTEKYGKPVTVVVAKADINELDLIDDTKVTVESVPRKFVMPGAFRQAKQVYNTIATVPIQKGEQITAPRVTFPGAKTGLSRNVNLGKRAISIAVSGDTAVSKLIKPGDRVDVISLIDYSGGAKDRQKVKTILQDVYVLATGLNVTNNIPIVGIKTPRVIRKMNLNTYSNFDSVTLEVDPFQAQKLVFLTTANAARPVLALRNNNDKSITRIKATSIFDLLGEDRAEAKKFFAEKAAKENQGR